MLYGRGQGLETGPVGRDWRMISQGSQESQTTVFCTAYCLMLELRVGRARTARGGGGGMGDGEPEGGLEEAE